METTLPYCGDLHIDSGTTQLIMNLLNSIRSAVPVVDPPEPDGPVCRHEETDLDYLRNVLVLARQHSAELEGIFNPDELLRYTKYVTDYQDIMTQLGKITGEIKSCRDSALKFAKGLAGMVEEHLRMTGKLSVSPENEKSAESLPTRCNGFKLKVV